MRQTFFHSMECQSGVRSGAAPASTSAADNLLVSLSRLAKVLS